MGVDEWKEVFHFYCEERNRQFVSNNLKHRVSRMTQRISSKELNRWERLEKDFGERHIKIVNASSKCEVFKVQEEEPYIKVFYKTRITWSLEEFDHHYEQAWIENRVCLMSKDHGWLIEEDELIESGDRGVIKHPMPLDAGYDIRNPNERRTSYDRKKAVEYAERWWDDYNPKFRQFDVDCTNYISQCLFAGGAPMKHSSDRAKGWWYRFESPVNWSFSWAVAHSLRLYLPTSQTGLQGKEVSSADQLQLGDVICYDFNGDGRWQHNTIVVDKDSSGMPLVNAHTDNSRHRYWSYKDSHAWTEKTAYKFFRISDNF